jgi:hypothetical protein
MRTRNKSTPRRAYKPLMRLGVDAAAAARENLNATYRRFMSGRDPERKSEAGKKLIRAVFGKDVVAEDSVL